MDLWTGVPVYLPMLTWWCKIENRVILKLELPRQNDVRLGRYRGGIFCVGKSPADLLLIGSPLLYCSTIPFTLDSTLELLQRAEAGGRREDDSCLYLPTLYE